MQPGRGNFGRVCSQRNAATGASATVASNNLKTKRVSLPFSAQGRLLDITQSTFS
jgi:hypothetical protein